MELADKVDDRRSSNAKSESFDSKLADSAYLVSEGGKSRLRGYLRTFGYMIFCGLLLVIGGGTFFIYESVVINRPLETQNSKLPSGRSAPLQDKFVMKNKAHYSKELQLVAFVFIGVGAVLFMVGVPFASRYYKRYRRVKEIERSPILDPLKEDKKKRKIYNEKASKKMKTQQSPVIWPGTSSVSNAQASSTTKTNHRNKRRKSKTGWMYRSPQKVSEGFRFAAHRHPSMNQIKLDGSFPERNFSADSSPKSSDEEVEDAPNNRKSRLRGFVNKLFGSNEKPEEQTNDKAKTTVPIREREASIEAHNSTTDDAKLRKEMTQRRSRGSIHNLAPTQLGKRKDYEELENSDPEIDFGAGQGGLYNLG